MLDLLIKRYFQLNIWVKIIFFFCLFGAFVNFFSICRDISTGGILLRLHAGFFVLYFSQIFLILAHERYTSILTLLQAFLALMTTADFIFVPLLRLVGNLFFVFASPLSVEGKGIYRYVFISLAFTLQVLAAYILFSLLPKTPYKKVSPKTETSVAE